MEFISITKKIILPLSMALSFPSLSYEICTREEAFNERIKKFSPNTEISELNDFGGLPHYETIEKLPNFEEETSELKFGVMEVFNLELSAFQLKDGIETGNTQEIVNSSVMLASTFVPTIVDGAMEALALEFDSDPVTMAIGTSIMVGLNIYNGVEADKTIEQQKQALSDADKIYKDRAMQLRNALSDYRGAILGNDNALMRIDEKNVSSLVLGALKKQIKTTITTLGTDAINKRTNNTQLTSLLRDSSNKHSYLVQDDIARTLENFSTFLDAEYTVKDRYIPYETKIYNLNRANWTYVGMWADIPEEDLQTALQGGIFTVLSSPFKHFYQNTLPWIRDVYLPTLDYTLNKVYANNDALFKVLKESIEYQLTDPGFQENLRVHYNTTINKKYAWIKFGSELLENLDLSKENAIEASLWTGRVLLPMVEPFIESSMLKKIYEELSVESKIATIVNTLMQSNVDINNKDAVYALIKADASSEDLPSSVMNAINIAYSKTLQDVNSLNLSKSDLKPFNVSKETVDKVINQLHTDINQGAFNQEVETALNKFALDILLFDTSNKKLMFDRLYAMAEKLSALQAAYNGHVVLAINKTKDKIRSTTDNQEIVLALQELGRHLIKNYMSFYESGDPIVMPNTNQDVSFITFGAEPFAKNDLKYILTTLNTEIENRLKAIDGGSKETLPPKGTCSPNDILCE